MGNRISQRAQARQVAMSEARAEISKAIGRAISEHELTYAEVLVALAEETRWWASHQQRAELAAAAAPRPGGRLNERTEHEPA